MQTALLRFASYEEHPYFTLNLTSLPYVALAKYGAREGIRTPTGFLPQPPQGCVSTNFTTPATNFKIQINTTKYSSPIADWQIKIAIKLLLFRRNSC